MVELLDGGMDLQGGEQLAQFTPDTQDIPLPPPSHLLAAKTIARGNPNDAAITDRVTKLLKGTEYSPLGDVVTASIASRKIGAPSFGEVFNSIRSERIKEAEAMQRLSQNSEQLRIQQERNDIASVGQLAKQNQEVGDAMKEWLQGWKGQVSPEMYGEIVKKSVAAIAGRPVTNYSDALHAMAEGISGMALPATAPDRTADERFLTKYREYSTKLRAGIPLTPEERDDYDFITSYRFTKVSPTPTGTQIVTPNFTQQAGPIQPSADGSWPKPGASIVGGMTPTANTPNIKTVEQAKKPLTQDAQDDLTASVNMWSYLSIMERTLGASGPIEGRVQKQLVPLGMGSQDAIDFDTAVSNARKDIQSLIKGIPSNYDQKIFERAQPSLEISPEVNAARIVFLRYQVKVLLATKLGYFRQLGYQIPESVTEFAQSIGVDPNSVKPLTLEQARAERNALADKAQSLAKAREVKTIDGKSYIKTDGKWRPIQ